MKTILWITVAAAWTGTNLIGQTLIYNNRVPQRLVAPVYGPEVGNWPARLHGNTAAGIPAATTIFSGAALSGEGYTAELWYRATELDTWAAVPGTQTTFRSGAAAGYFWPLTDPILPGLSPGDTPLLQLRVWENRTLDSNAANDLTSYAMAAADPTALQGTSMEFLCLPLGGPSPAGPITSPVLSGLRSFNIAAIPEPGIAISSAAAIGLGFLLIFPGRKGQ